VPKNKTRLHKKFFLFVVIVVDVIAVAVVVVESVFG